MLKLHCFGESGHSYKVALGLTFAGIDWEPVFIDFFNGAARSDAYAEINEMAEAPTLEFEDGRRMSQSGVILDWIAKETGAFAGPSEDPEVLRWVLWDNHKMSAQAGVARFFMHFLAEKHRRPDVVSFLQGRVKVALDILERRLENREWVATDALSAADLSCCSYLFYPEPFGFERAERPAISAWLARIEALPGWKHPYDMMPRAYPPERPKETPDA